MGFTGTSGHIDSILSFKDSIIEFGNKSISAKTVVADSLSNIILKQSKVVPEIGHCELFRIKSFHFLHHLQKFMISKDTFEFVACCCLMGFVIVFADWATFKAGTDPKRVSLLGLKYEKGRIFFNYLLWGIGSGLLAYLCAGLGIFKYNLPSCILIAVTWPALLSKIIKKLDKTPDDDGVEQITTT